LLRLAQDAPRTAALEAGRTRLELLGMTAVEIAEIERTGQARRLVTVVSPHGGVVLRRGVSVGTAVDPSTEIVTLADLSAVWVLAEVPQSESGHLTQGALATLSFPALGRAPFTARVALVYPTPFKSGQIVEMYVHGVGKVDFRADKWSQFVRVARGWIVPRPDRQQAAHSVEPGLELVDQVRGRDAERLRGRLPKGLGREHVGHFGGADAEGKRAEGPVCRGVRIAAHDSHPRLRQPLLGTVLALQCAHA